MENYFLCDPLSLVPPPGPSALKILVEVPDYSAPMEPFVKLTVLEAVQLKFGSQMYQECLKAGPIPIQKRTDVKEQLPAESWTARNAFRVWFINDSEDHYRYFDAP
jgi:hypothetical protein